MLPIFLIAAYFLCTFVILTWYTKGDQEHYRALYDALEGSKLAELLSFSNAHLGSYEPLSPFILWLGSNLGINKDIYISLLNLVLIFSIVLFLRRNKTSWVLIFLFLTNYYFIVLLTGAERLKIAYIFLLFFVISNSGWRYIFICLAVLSHFQSLILLIAGIFSLLGNIKGSAFSHFKLNSKKLFGILLIFGFGILFSYFFSQGLFLKINAYYMDDFDLRVFFQFGILMLIAFFISKNKIKILITCLTFIPFLILLGGTRVNMIIFTLVIYLLTLEGRQNNMPVFCLMLYMSIKTIPFVFNVLENGTGFI